MDALGDRSKAVYPHASVLCDRNAAEQLGELAGGRTPKQVHLEEAILAMDKAERARHVQSTGGSDRRNAQGVTLHPNRCAESGQRPFSIELRQACQKL